MPQRLPIRPGPVAGETLAGYIVRLGHANGRRDLQAFARSMGMPFSIIAAAGIRSFDLTTLSKATGIEPARLATLSPVPSAPGLLTVRGLELPRWMVSAAGRRVCPACLAASPHHRALWDLTLAAVCPVHRVRFLSACPRCATPLKWTDPGLNGCSLGHSLAATPASRVPESDTEGVAWLQSLLENPGCGHGLLAKDLGGLGPGQAVGLAWALGWFACSGPGQPGRQRSRGPDPNAVLNGGYRILRGWPQSFHALLGELRAAGPSRPGRCGARKELGPLATWVAGSGDDPGCAVVKSELSRYADMAGDLRSRCPALAAGAQATTITLSAAARLLGRSISGLLPELRRNGVVVRAGGGGKGVPVLLDRAAVEAIAEDCADSLTSVAAARALGCGRKGLQSLIAAGLLRAIDVPGRSPGSPARWSARCVRQLIEAMEARVIPAPGAVLTLPAAMRALRQRGIPPAKAALAVFSDDVRPAGVDRNAVGLTRILLPAGWPGDVVHVGLDARTDVGIPAAAKIMRIKQEVAYHLCAVGLIATRPPGGLARGRRIEAVELARFAREFVFTSQVETKSRGHRGWLADRMIAAGAVPVSGPAVDGGRQWLFRRQDLKMVAIGS